MTQIRTIAEHFYAIGNVCVWSIERSELPTGCYSADQTQPR